MSAPHSIGRHRYGEGTVLSSTSGISGLVRDLRQRLDVDDVDERIAQRLGVEQLGIGLIAFLKFSGSAGSTNVVSMPSFFRLTCSSVCVPP